jgi:lysophospholipase L1-like esterase
MKKVLLLGDSIRLNYAPYVYRNLNEQAEILSPEDNGRFAKYTLHELPGWLKTLGTPDIIHFNNGLWDLHHFNGKDPLTPLADYLADLKRIILLLQETKAQLIFATCTPVRNENPEWSNSEIVIYNQQAVKLMAENHIPVNDLHTLLFGEEETYISDDLIHLNRLGIKKVGEKVVETIKQWL